MEVWRGFVHMNHGTQNQIFSVPIGEPIDGVLEKGALPIGGKLLEKTMV